MKLMHIAAAVIAGLILFGVTATAQDQASDAVQSAWNKYQTELQTYQQKRTEIVAEFQRVRNDAEADAETKAKAEAEARAKLAELGAALEAPRKAFHKAFAAADFTQYLEQREMLEAGLLGVAGEKREDAPADAVKLYEAFLKYCGDSRQAGDVRTYFLPVTIAATGDLERAAKRTRELMTDADENQRPMMLVRVGDFIAATGDTAGALKIYEEALKAIGSSELGPRDPRASAKRYAEARLNLIGKDAPNFTCETWFGSDKQSLSDFKGNVVIVDFWATWCGPCRVAMPGINKIHQEYAERGLRVIGLTRVYHERDGSVRMGYLPESEGEIVKVKPVEGLDEEGYVKHVGEFRDISGISYPFAVGTSEDFNKYGVTGIPQMVIVDRQGKVAMIIVGSGNDALIEAGVKNLLERK